MVNIFHRDLSLEPMASAKFVQVYLGLVIDISFRLACALRTSVKKST